jgi:hypothetical protein
MRVKNGDSRAGDGASAGTSFGPPTAVGAFHLYDVVGRTTPERENAKHEKDNGARAV